MSKGKKAMVWGSFDRTKGRATAFKALKELRGVVKQMASDNSICQMYVSQFDDDLKVLGERIECYIPSLEKLNSTRLRFEGEGEVLPLVGNWVFEDSKEPAE